MQDGLFLRTGSLGAVGNDKPVAQLRFIKHASAVATGQRQCTLLSDSYGAFGSSVVNLQGRHKMCALQQPFRQTEH